MIAVGPPLPRARRRVPAAATRGVAALLSGPEQSATVVHAGSSAAYLRLADGGCVALLATSARAVPCGLRTTEPRLRVTVGAEATVGGGALLLEEYDVRVGRLVDAGVPRPPSPSDPAPILRHPRVRAVRAELPGAALAALTEDDPTAVEALLGRGSGLTPVGDDVLCGYLAARPGHPPAVVAEVERLARRRTTALSAALLACAADGEVLPEYADLVRELAAPAVALDRLVAVGHTSGAGLALGLGLALTASARRRSGEGIAW